MKKQNGFTLIELVIVIIVLGILAATAVPKFINLQDDAKESAMSGVEAAIHSAANIVYSKAAIDGIETSQSGDSVDAAGTQVNVVFGYPAATDDNGIGDAVELTGFVAKATTAPTTTGLMFVGENDQAENDLCLVYEPATSGATYTLTNGTVQATVTSCL